MQVIKVRNVHDALIRGLDTLNSVLSVESNSRNGKVYEALTPVTTVFSNPAERVMFWEERDANPFFHFMEGLWMLDGRNDLKFIQKYNQKMKEYSDDGETLHGAYGWRWRNYFYFDQLPIIAERLRKDHTDRRCVLQIWDSIQDLGKNGKDVPCNTSIYFKVNHKGALQMTVSNRSNDIIWGAYGANAVHMSMLQEFMAAYIGVPIGEYYQISDNYHAYTEVYDELVQKFFKRDALDFYGQQLLLKYNPYTKGEVSPYPMINTSIKKWGKDLYEFLYRAPFEDMPLKDPFFRDVAVPIQDSWWLYKEGRTDEAMIEIQNCKATDWTRACWEWFERRLA